MQRLHGMGEGVYREVLRAPDLALRVYAPVGEHRDLLAYLVRRLLENGANSSFVHQLADPPAGRQAARSPLAPPGLGQPLPRDSTARDAATPGRRPARAAARAAAGGLDAERVPAVPEADAREGRRDDAAPASRLGRLERAPVPERAALLERAADLLEADWPPMRRCW